MAAILVFSLTNAAQAFPGGIFGVTTVGCTCHGPANTATSLSVPNAGGGISARAGETLNLSLMVAHSGSSAAGMNLAIVNSSGMNAGTLIAGAGSRLAGGELTHSAPVSMSGNSASFPFQWTAPTEAGTYTLRAVGNAVNRDGSTSGDSWNSLSPITITVMPSAPAGFSISGRILNASGVGVSEVIITDGTRTATTDAQGNYTLTGVPNGSYTLTAARINWTFSPATIAVTVNGANVSGQNFTGTRLWAVRGTILNPSGVAISDVIVSAGSSTATTDAQGNYTLWLANGTYTIRAARTNWAFSPETRSLTVNGADLAAQNFVGTRLWAVRGTILNPSGAPVPDVLLSAGPAIINAFSTISSTATTDAQGNYTLWVASGNYTIRVARTNWAFSPETRDISVSGADLTAQNFTGTRLWAVRGTIVNASGSPVPDVVVSANAGNISVSTATTDAQGAYTLWLANGTYTLTPSRTNWAFSPATLTATVVGADVAADRITGRVLMSSARNSDEASTLAVYPNPGTDFITVSYQTSSHQRINHEVFTSLGELVRYFEVEQSAGTHRFTLPLEGLPRGIYHVRVRSSAGVLGRASLLVQP